MSITAWRICKQAHAGTAFDGEGARRFGGRWNNPGTAVVYLAQSQALAALEMLVHLQSAELMSSYILIPLEIAESLILDLDRSCLPQDWRADPAPATARSIGDAWIAAGTSAVLRVPSTLVPDESNFLLNPRHPAASGLRPGKAIGFFFDRFH